jgi:uncharacterized protein (DUF1778 family)
MNICYAWPALDGIGGEHVAARDSAVRDQAISLRISRDERSLIDRASEVAGTSRTDFMIEAARRHAEEILLDQTFFRPDAESYDRFVALLEAPPEPVADLRRLLRDRAPWE